MIQVGTTTARLCDDELLRGVGLQPAPHGASFADWIHQIIREGISTSSAQGRMLLAYVIDQFWEDHKQACPQMVLTEIERVADVLLLEEVSRSRTGPSAVVRFSAATLGFIYQEYLPALRSRFSGAFLAGSMSYGRFLDVEAPAAGAWADLDLLLIAANNDIRVADLLLDGELVDDIDQPARVQQFVRALERRPCDLLNYKLRHVRSGLHISLTICTEFGFSNLSNLDGEAPGTCNLHWTGSMGGSRNVQTDLSGQLYDDAYSEIMSFGSNILTVPVFTFREQRGLRLKRFNGFAAMIVPRFEILFASRDVKRILTRFISGVCEMAEAFHRAELSTNICNTHVRSARFSPLFREKMDRAFRAEMAKRRAQKPTNPLPTSESEIDE